MSAHTPGPWSVIEYGDGDSLVVHYSDRERICFMATPGDSPGAMARIEANARLIAAAPELLEAGQVLVAALEERRAAKEAWEGMIGKTMPDTEIEAIRLRFVRSGDQLVNAETALRAAIAKATIQPLSGGEGE